MTQQNPPVKNTSSQDIQNKELGDILSHSAKDAKQHREKNQISLDMEKRERDLQKKRL